MPRNKISKQYDLISEKYDDLFIDESSIIENKEVYKKIKEYTKGTILDIGCGTGLFLDMLGKKTKVKYTGIDPSPKMLSKLIIKYPMYLNNLINASYEEIKLGKYDIVISLFGSVSYIKKKKLKSILENVADGGKYFLMFYKEGYTPKTYRKTNIYVEHEINYINDLKKIYKNVYYFNNYIIATNIDGNKNI